MPHEIFGNRFAARTVPAWHGLGRMFEGPMLATEAVRYAGADFPLTRSPLFAKIGEELVQLEDEFAIVRGALPEVKGIESSEEERRPAVLGTCTREFEAITNMELAELLDPLTTYFPVETVGVLGNGERIFFCLRDTRNSHVDGDELRNYFTVLDTKTPGHAARIFYSPVRVVCQNTLTRGERSASISFDIIHRRGVLDEFIFYSGLIDRMIRQRDETVEAFRTMSITRIDRGTTGEIINRVFPYPERSARAMQLEQHDFPELIAQGVRGAERLRKKATHAQNAWEKSCERVESYRDAAWSLIRTCFEEESHHAGYVWSVYNACTEVSDWRKGRGRIGESVLFGPRALEKGRAFTACMEYCATMS